MTRRTPTISVLMPVRNAERYLAQAVRSILGQTLGDFELILVDDGSTDRSRAIAEQFTRHDARVCVLRQSGGGGIAASLNTALAQAAGRYLARMDADDVARPRRLEKQAVYLDADRQCVAVGCWIQHMDPFDVPLRIQALPSEHQEIDQAFLAGDCGVIAHPAVMMRREAVRRVGGYRGRYSEDLDLFLRLGEVGRLANLPEVLLNYREHLDSWDFTQRKAQFEAVEQIVREAWRRRGMQPPADLFERRNVTIASGAERLRSWALHAIRHGNLAVARRHAWALLRRAPFALESWRILRWAMTG